MIVLTAKEKVRLLPPLTIHRAELDAGVELLAKVLVNLKEKAEMEKPGE